jgi:hypothetical protein
MRMDREKVGIVLIALASLVGIVILAAALHGFSFTEPYQLEQSGSEVSGLARSDALMRLMLIVLAVLLPLVTILLMLASRHRRWLLVFLLAAALVVYLITQSDSGDQPLVVDALLTITPEALQQDATTPQPTLAPASEVEEVRVTPGLVWLISLGLGGLLVGVVALVWLVWRAYHRGAATPLQTMVASAETALRALEQGEEVQGTILRCYREMLSAAYEVKGVERPDYLTPAEFIQRLVKAGLPPQPVERLTHLFETVRYSAQPATKTMEAEAAACLQAVIAGTKDSA